MSVTEPLTPIIVNGTDTFRMNRAKLGEPLAIGDEIEFTSGVWRKRYKVERIDRDDYVFTRVP